MALVMVYKTPSATPTFTAGATISGTLEAANVLTCAYAVTGSNGEVVRWYRHTADDGSDPTGTLIGEGLTYLLTSNENGRYIRVIVTATNAAGSETSTSAYTAKVVAPPPPEPPSFTSPVTISGTAQVGQTLTVQYTPSNADDAAVTWTSYTTEDKQGPVTLGTGLSYLLTPAEDGRWIGVRVVLNNAIGETAGEDIVPMSGVDPWEPALPNEYVPPAYDISGMNLVYCNAGDNLQSKINSLVPGDCLVVEAGVTWNGPFTITESIANGNDWIYIISSEMANLPGAGVRVAPSHTGITADYTTGVFTVPGHGLSEGQKIVFSSLNGGPELKVGTYYYARDVTTDTFKVYAAAAGGSPVAFTTNVVDGDIMLDAANMFRVLSPNNINGDQNAWRIHYGCKKLRFCGMHVQLGYTGIYNKYTIFSVPCPSSQGGGGSGYAEDIVFDRCYVSGNRGVVLRDGMVTYAARRLAVINSHFCEIHGTDESHGIQVYWDGRQITIENNRLEAGGINCFVGDNTTTNPGATRTIEDVVVRGNYLYKPTRWWVDAPDYEGKAWESKNGFETKGSIRLLVEGNVIHNTWVKTQHGNAFLVTPRGYAVIDTTFRNNVCYNCWAGPNINNTDKYILRCKLENNVVYKLTGPSSNMILMASSYMGAVNYVKIVNNTFVAGIPLVGASFISLNGNTSQVGYITNLRVVDNIIDQQKYAVKGNGTGSGTTALNIYATDYYFGNNGAFRSVAGQPGTATSKWEGWVYSGGNVASVKFTDDTLATLEGFVLLPTSPFYKNDSRNNDRGANIPAVIAAINDRVI